MRICPSHWSAPGEQVGRNDCKERRSPPSGRFQRCSGLDRELRRRAEARFRRWRWTLPPLSRLRGQTPTTKSFYIPTRTNLKLVLFPYITVNEAACVTVWF